ncbi:helix-turn-helix transcriptional regulator [Streptomyces sp. NPDC048606]|uniref:helix-turn-helix transcriptional regulator n=1 Tax=Streptomyces sp. NPDC048606 TaxID=3154726 RepID=UPI003417FEB0
MSAHYAPVRVSGEVVDPATAIVRRVSPRISVDQLDFRYGFSFDAEPLDHLCVLSIRRGTVTVLRESGAADTCGPGNVMIPSLPGQPYRGRAAQSGYTAVLLHPSVLHRVAGTEEDSPCPVSGFRAVSRAAEDRLSMAVSYLGSMAESPGSEAWDSALVMRTAAEHLAAIVLDSFPRRAGEEELSLTETRSAHAGTWQRAVRFIEENADRAIGIADIARAAKVTPRAVQYAFARHAGTTPLACLRTARLACAHADLSSAEPGPVTVAQVAARWGFSHPGRFSALYRQAYGVPPSVTLNRR